MACLLESILVAWDGLGVNFAGQRDILGTAWVPGWHGRPRMGGISWDYRILININKYGQILTTY